MAEELTEAQKATEENTLKAAAENVSQKAEQAMADAAAGAQALIDNATQALADIPGKIEDTINDIKETFEKLLGRVKTPTTDPDSLDFDFNAAMGKVKQLLDPLISVVKPIEAVVGKVPIIGDLASAMTTMSSQAAPQSGLSKEDIKAMVPAKPEIPPALKVALEKLLDTIQALCIQLPMLLINLIFEMINVIYSKLQIITSVIPLGSFFPLSLVPSAIQAAPKIKDFVTNAPGEIKNMVEGLLKDKMAEAQAAGSTAASSIKNAADATQNAASGAADAAGGAAAGAAGSAASGAVQKASGAAGIQAPATSSLKTPENKAPGSPEEKPMDWKDVEDKWTPIMEGLGFSKSSIKQYFGSERDFYCGKDDQVQVDDFTKPVKVRIQDTRSKLLPKDMDEKLTKLMSNQKEFAEKNQDDRYLACHTAAKPSLINPEKVFGLIKVLPEKKLFGFLGF